MGWSVMSLASLRRGPLVELATSQLQDQLLAGNWPVGSRLPSETVLADRLGVGRSTVREAVRAMVHAGILETRQGAGTFVLSVTRPSDWEPRLRRAAVLEVYEVREGLERQAARLAASRRTPEDITAITAALSERQRSWSPARSAVFVEADLAFHRAVVVAAHNPLLTELFDSIATVLRDAITALGRDEDLTTDASDAHTALAEAVAAGDVAAAASATDANLQGTAAAVRELLDS